MVIFTLKGHWGEGVKYRPLTLTGKEKSLEGGPTGILGSNCMLSDSNLHLAQKVTNVRGCSTKI